MGEAIGMVNDLAEGKTSGAQAATIERRLRVTLYFDDFIVFTVNQ